MTEKPLPAYVIEYDANGIFTIDLPPRPTDLLAYFCDQCRATFPVDPADPSTAEGDYADHMHTHDEVPD